MSYAIIPFAVDLSMVRAVIGCGDADLADSLAESWSSQLAEIDDLAWGDESVPKARTVFWRMLIGDEPEADHKHGYVHGYCLKILCRVCGDLLPNASWSGMRFSWFETVQSALDAAEVDFDPVDLISGGAGIALPPIGDFPNIGHLARADLPGVRAELARADAESVPDETALTAILEIRDWIDRCLATERDLVCFYH
ncbi:DUF7691 family protein [Spirillospora sp. CA-294931]|uniref:DUF7691 family protein n=1 Tax=Spirillospora sp. CA-294931 TaxID=3240042 RepID=UPI003D89BDA3